MKKLISLMTIFLLAGCTSTGKLGIVTKGSNDPGALLKNPNSYKELGPVAGGACRFFFFSVIPWGDATFSTAVDNALAEAGGDALINVTASNSLYGFFYFLAYTCTSVTGMAIKFDCTLRQGRK